MAESAVGSPETVLVVEYTDVLLNVIVGILEAANFRVLHANSGTDALKLAADYSGKIDLLLSDVNMPEMSGPELGDRLKRARPDIHVMFMSGFRGGELLVLNYGWAFIDKPFVPKQLVEMVNAVLHSDDKSQGNHKFDTREDNGASR
jgi:two-component system, cell cycle sensor histidine kinase and response regulator CckA